MLGTEVKTDGPRRNPRFAKEVVSVGTLDDEVNDRAYWLGRPAEERIAGVEFLRRQFYSYASAEPEFRRFLEVAEREGR